MNEHFGDWYREAELEPDADKLEKRWQGIKNFATSRKKRKRAGVLDLVRIFYGLSPNDDSLTQNFRGFFFRTDPLFPMRDNTLELRVLSGAVIAYLIEKHPAELGDMLSLAVICGECQGLRKKLPIFDILQIALDTLVQRSISRRIDYPDTSLPGGTLDDDILGHNLPSQPNEVANYVSTGFNGIVSSINGFYETTSEIINSLNELLQLQQEELNILWWLFSKSSRDLKQPFTKLEPMVGCLVAGKELADLVTIMPGPLQVKVFFNRILSSIEGGLTVKASIQDVINMVPREWKENLLQETRFRSNENLLPIHLAVSKSLETDGEADWIPAFEKASGLVSSDNISLEQLSLQIYRERLFLKSLAS
jgi:hypothetical protein